MTFCPSVLISVLPTKFVPADTLGAVSVSVNGLYVNVDASFISCTSVVVVLSTNVKNLSALDVSSDTVFTFTSILPEPSNDAPPIVLAVAKAVAVAALPDVF